MILVASKGDMVCTRVARRPDRAFAALGALMAALVAHSGCLGSDDETALPQGVTISIPGLRVGDRYEYTETVAALESAISRTVEVGNPGPMTSPCYVGERVMVPFLITEQISGFTISRVWHMDEATGLIAVTETTISGLGSQMECSLLDYKGYSRSIWQGFFLSFATLPLAGASLEVSRNHSVPVLGDNVTVRIGPETSPSTDAFEIHLAFPHYDAPEANASIRSHTLLYDGVGGFPLDASYSVGGSGIEIRRSDYHQGNEPVLPPHDAPPLLARVRDEAMIPFGDDPELDGGTSLLSFAGALETARGSAAYAAYALAHDDPFVVYAEYGPATTGQGLGMAEWCIEFASVSGSASGEMENEGFRSCVQGQDATDPPLRLVTSEQETRPTDPVQVPLEYARTQPRISLSRLVEDARNENPAGVGIEYWGGVSEWRWGTAEAAFVVFSPQASQDRSTYSAITGQLLQVSSPS